MEIWFIMIFWMEHNRSLFLLLLLSLFLFPLGQESLSLVETAGFGFEFDQKCSEWMPWCGLDQWSVQEFGTSEGFLRFEIAQDFNIKSIRSISGGIFHGKYIQQCCVAVSGIFHGGLVGNAVGFATAAASSAVPVAGPRCHYALSHCPRTLAIWWPAACCLIFSFFLY